MRNLVRLLAVAGLVLLLRSSATAADRPPQRDNAPDPAFGEIAKTIRGTDPRSKSARLGLYYAEKFDGRFIPPTRNSVKTSDGKTAEIALIEVPAMFMPGEDFSMGILSIDGRAVDWASCWTSNRIARQDLCLEDVDGDGDGFVDVAFRAMKGWLGLQDKRQNRRPGDERIWLAAYSITSKGLKPIFPVKDRTHHLKVSFDNKNGPLRFHVTGLPESLPESEMCECIVSATNISKQPVSLPADWFSPKTDAGIEELNRSTGAPVKSIQPGQTVSQTIILRLVGDQDDVHLRWSFEKSRVTTASEVRTDALADDPGEESHAPFWYDAIDPIHPSPPPQPLERFPFETARP